METCSNCGAVARPGAKFCTTCGSRLSAPEAPASMPGWQQPTTSTTESSDNQDTTNASASENEASRANTSGDTSTDAPAPSSWSWGSSADTAAANKDVTPSSESSAESVTPVESDSGADETVADTSSSATTSTTSPSWLWRSSTSGAGDSDTVASDRDHEDAATAGANADAQEGANQNSDQDTYGPADSDATVHDGASSPLADVTSSAGDSGTNTAPTSTWSWGESNSSPEHDASGSSGVESTGATSDVTDADVNAEIVNAHEAPVADTTDEDRTSESETPRATRSETNGGGASSDVDVSSAFKDDTGTEGEGEETLSSWAARWNETEGGADSGAAAEATSRDSASADTATTTDTSDSPARDAGTDFTEQSPLEGAPGGQQPTTDESANDTGTHPAASPDYGIEDAPGGQFPQSDATETDAGTDPDVSVFPADERENAYHDQTSATDETGSTGSGSGDESATTATDEVVDDEGTTAAANEPIDEPSGAHGSEVTPGTDSDLVNPLVGMDVSPTTTATGQEPDNAGFASERASDSSAGNARDRAEQLIDELRSLLPTLAASGSAASDGSGSKAGANAAAGSVAGAGTGSNLQPVIDGLTAARPQAGSFDDLRTALEKARTNPRDVDTMLDLVGRVDDLIALLDSQDRLNDAASHAIDQLQQAGTHTEG
ncbi:MAG: zinc ribbon domain-containing protein [Thermomicrobiales bacterium]